MTTQSTDEIMVGREFYHKNLSCIIEEGLKNQRQKLSWRKKREWIKDAIENFIARWEHESGISYSEIDRKEKFINLVLSWQDEDDSINITNSIYYNRDQNPIYQLEKAIEGTQKMIHQSTPPQWIQDLSTEYSKTNIKLIMRDVLYCCRSEFIKKSNLNPLYYGISEKDGLIPMLNYYHAQILKTPLEERPFRLRSYDSKRKRMIKKSRKSRK